MKHKSVFVGGLPPEVDLAALRKMLSWHSPFSQDMTKFIIYAQIYTAKAGFVTNYAILRFSATAHAMLAVRLDGLQFEKYSCDVDTKRAIAQRSKDYDEAKFMGELERSERWKKLFSEAQLKSAICVRSPTRSAQH